MDKKSSSNRNMYQILLNLFILFSPVWSTFAAFSSAVTSFRNKVLQIDDTAEKQQTSLKSYNTNKRKKKRTMADKALITRGKLSAFAAVTGDTILLGKMRIPFYKLYYSKDATAYGNAEIIYEAAMAMIPAQRTAYNISDQELLDLRAAIDDFKNLPSPTQMKVIRQQLTALLPELFKEGNAILTDVIDGLMHQYKESNPDFYNQYLNARPVLESHRHTTIEIFTSDQSTGEYLEDVQVVITSSKDSFQEMTDVQGKTKQQISPEIDYKITLNLPEYEPETFENVKLNRGKHQKLKVKLRKINS